MRQASEIEEQELRQLDQFKKAAGQVRSDESQLAEEALALAEMSALIAM